ncbi:MAG: bifunctional riboflavin kinase/FAD synthetase [Gammaproteobacteria bacterium]|nr:bifunctional riboflavin kinase/FAD synthetase [Gammaproteobacteria bacterium]
MLTDVRLIRHLSDLPYAALQRGSIMTVGAYDGLHLGHQQLLDRVVGQARATDLPSIVMSFEPTPKEFFSVERPPARLMRFREKFEALAESGIDYFYCPRFAPWMRAIPADAFIRRILVHGLNVRHLVVGDDFRFARKREGTVEHLVRASKALQYTVDQVSSVVVDGIRVSSTAIRDALRDGEIARATALLGGRPYQMSGKVIRGRQVGRSLGYATANVDLRRRQSAVLGIYAVRVRGLPGSPLDGVASVGTRPTFGLQKPLLEVHLFDFDTDIYGKYIHVDFIARLRDVEKFSSVDELVAQMKIDAENARAALAADLA